MSFPFPIIFDMDDTVCDTNHYMYNGLLNHFTQHRDVCPAHKAIWLMLQQGYQHTIKLGRLLDTHAPDYAKLYNGVCMDELLIDGEFMLHVHPLHNMIDYIANVLRPHVHNRRISLHVGTHRGFCAVAAENTKAWLDRQGVLGLFSDVHVLDPVTTPDKREFFDDLFGEDYLLVDDNPCKVDPGKRSPQLLISEQVHPVLPHLANQNSFRNIEEFNAHLTELNIIPYK